MHRVIVVGSPRPDGRSAALADELFNACIEECPEDGVSIVSVASLSVGPCRGCDACKPAGQAPEKLPESDDNLAIMPLVAASDAVLHRCVIHDDMTDVRKHLDAADELIVVTPVYFASVPAQLKCLMDRLQPYYWTNLRKGQKRPMVLHVVGEGGDPHGIEPLIGTVRSAFGCVGFELELVLDWVGKIDESGEIVAEAAEYPIPPLGGFAGFIIDGNEFEIVEVDGEFPEGLFDDDGYVEDFAEYGDEGFFVADGDSDDDWDEPAAREAVRPEKRAKLSLAEGDGRAKKPAAGKQQGGKAQLGKGGKGGKNGSGKSGKGQSGSSRGGSKGGSGKNGKRRG